jgi:Holliday junction resolvase RusA-like endonuclease
MIRFVIPGPAVGKGRPRASSIGGGIRLYTPAKTVEYENEIKVLAKTAMLVAGRQAPSSAPISAEVWVMVAPPKSMSRKKQLMAFEGDIFPTTKPDLDNVAKAILDACNHIVYEDDKQVIDLVIRRRYAQTPGVMVYLSEVLV